MTLAHRPQKMTIRLTEREEKIRDALCVRYGISGSGIMRQALLKLGMAEGITVDEPPPPPPKGKKRNSSN